MGEYQKIYDTVLTGDDSAAQEEAQALFEKGVPPMEIINQGLIAAMEEIGALFKEGELFIPEVMMAAQTVTGVIELLAPHMPHDVASRGVVVIGTVKGDLHDIGKNLVILLLSSNGYKVHDLGSDVAPQAFVEAAQQYNADIVALSALLTITMENMALTISELQTSGVREKVKIIIGGAPVTAEYAEEIEADGYAEDAQAAVELVGRLLEGKS